MSFSCTTFWANQRQYQTTSAPLIAALLPGMVAATGTCFPICHRFLYWFGQCCDYPDLLPRHVFDLVRPLKKLLCTKLFPWNMVNVTALVFSIPDLANGAFLSVNRDNDVCKCDQGTCDCNKETQRSFCSCFKGFEGITSKLRRCNQMVTSQIRELFHARFITKPFDKQLISWVTN